MSLVFSVSLRINRVSIDPEDFAGTRWPLPSIAFISPCNATRQYRKVWANFIPNPFRRQKPPPFAATLIGNFETRCKSNPDSFPRDCPCRSFLYRPLPRRPYLSSLLSNLPPLHRCEELTRKVIQFWSSNGVTRSGRAVASYRCSISVVRDWR